MEAKAGLSGALVASVVEVPEIVEDRERHSRVSRWAESNKSFESKQSGVRFRL
jgi:hypothetical protein